MNVYDFDGTIYDGDSTVDFFLFALKRKPSLIRYCFGQAMGFLLYGMKRIGKTELKERFFSFLPGVDAPTLVEEFWNHNHHKIYKWYLDQQQPDDIIISASPEFLLQSICTRLGIRHLIASRVDPRTGRFSGENCRGREKVQRLAEEYQVTHIGQFYSDSHSDLPLAQIADQAFLVNKGVVSAWEPR
jgi:HAD superfamily phosphoserine phosphatase-like hydrolase